MATGTRKYAVYVRDDATDPWRIGLTSTGQHALYTDIEDARRYLEWATTYGCRYAARIARVRVDGLGIHRGRGA